MNNEASSKIYEASYNVDFQSKNSPFLDEGVFFLQSHGVFTSQLITFLNSPQRMLIGNTVAQW